MKIQFSIRELLLITAIVALAAAWWMDRTRIIQNGQADLNGITQMANSQMDASQKILDRVLDENERLRKQLSGTTQK